MKHTLTLIVAVFFGTMASAQSGAQSFDNHILVKFNDGISAVAVEQILSDYQMHIVRTIPEIGIQVAKPNQGSFSTHQLANLSANSAVKYAERNGTYHVNASEISDVGETDEFAERIMQGYAVEEAWNITKGSKDVTVAVIDTGVNLTHQDLKNQIWTNTKEIADNGIDDDGNGYVDDVHGWNFFADTNDPTDDHNHGSHCSGTVGGEGNGIGIVGVNWTVGIMPIKFLNSSGSGSWEGAVLSILYAANNGAHIISASWGAQGEESSAVKDAIVYAHEKNVLFVAAAGNSGKNTDREPHYPSSYELPNLISVAATGSSWLSNLTFYSNYGAMTVNIAAPGEYVYSAGSRCNDCYLRYRGTSMATPGVAGIAALVLSVHPNLDVKDLRNAILSGTRHGGASNTSTLGRASAKVALEQFNQGPQIWPKLTTVRRGAPFHLTTYGFDGEVSYAHNKKTGDLVIDKNGNFIAQKRGAMKIRATSSTGQVSPEITIRVMY